jgi:hypothetical protein
MKCGIVLTNYCLTTRMLQSLFLISSTTTYQLVDPRVVASFAISFFAIGPTIFAIGRVRVEPAEFPVVVVEAERDRIEGGRQRK